MSLHGTVRCDACQWRTKNTVVVRRYVDRKCPKCGEALMRTQDIAVLDAVEALEALGLVQNRGAAGASGLHVLLDTKNLKGD